MREGAQLIRVHPGGFEHMQRRFIDLVDRINVENVTLFRLNRHDQHVGRAKHSAVLLVKLNVRVARRVEVKEVRVHAHV